VAIGAQSPFPDVRRSHIFRIIVVGVLVLVLQIPILMIDGLIRERQQRRAEAVEEVASKWGRQQAVTGPALVVPYVHRWTEETSKGRRIEQRETRYATFLPERLALRGRLEAEARRRGIFSVPVYRASLQAQGSFARPRFTEWGVDERDVDWGHAQLAIGVSDTRAVRAPTSLKWNGAPVEMLPGTGKFSGSSTGVHAEVAVPPGVPRIGFSFPLEFQGSAGAYWTPLGKTTGVRLASNWRSPSFQGNWLPLRHSVSPRGFEAEWGVAYLGRNFPQSWRDDAVTRETIEASRFGVDLIATVDHYRMAGRSVKYAGLFLLLTFATVWLVEVLCAMQVHPIQYLLLGGALCVFYLLELSLSEHLGFGRAYLLATLAVVAQVGGYTAAVLRSRGRAAIVAGMVAALYGYLYVLLNNEDYALLIGSLGVFAILAAIMYLTRRVDWYASGPARQGPAGSE
jgi:inner membrane protein